MKYAKLALVLTMACTGCTTLALEHHTLSQGASPTDIRYQEVLDNLAMVARDPYALPAYSSIFAGTAQITDTAQLLSTTTIGPGAGVQTINPQYTRAVLGNWTLDPINSPEKLEAMRCACRWVIYGEESACQDCVDILLTPEEAVALDPTKKLHYSGRHFGVAERMHHLPPDWLRKGKLCDVPAGACYKAHSGNMWVWVMPEGLKGLADFSLILQDIARVDINSPTLQWIRVAPSDLVFPTLSTNGPLCKDGPCKSPIASTFSGIMAEVSVDQCGHLMPDNPYYRWRVENLGSDPNLRSQISAAASGLH